MWGWTWMNHLHEHERESNRALCQQEQLEHQEHNASILESTESEAKQILKESEDGINSLVWKPSLHFNPLNPHLLGNIFIAGLANE